MGFFHTLTGPDHYLPFVMMGMARKWSLTKTSMITVLCGLGHVLSSVVLGFFGVALGLAVKKLEAFEGMRGEWAAWLLIGFGLAYFVWGVRRAWKNRPHTHTHFHAEGGEHEHEHQHAQEHSHVHTSEKANITPWVLFVIFVLGPCEPLIPILIYPAAKGSMLDVAIVAGAFSLVTIGTMLTVVVLSLKGIHLLPMRKMERYTHALAGAAICLCGCAIQFLGL